MNEFTIYEKISNQARKVGTNDLRQLAKIVSNDTYSKDSQSYDRIVNVLIRGERRRMMLSEGLWILKAMGECGNHGEAGDLVESILDEVENNEEWFDCLDKIEIECYGHKKLYDEGNIRNRRYTKFVDVLLWYQRVQDKVHQKLTWESPTSVVAQFGDKLFDKAFGQDSCEYEIEEICFNDIAANY